MPGGLPVNRIVGVEMRGLIAIGGFMQKTIGAMLLVLGSATVLMAQTQAPEIDPTLAVSALTLIAGAALVIRGRRKK